MRRLSALWLGIGLLPAGRAVRRRHLHRRHLVFRAVGRPVGIIGGDRRSPASADDGRSCRRRPARRGRSSCARSVRLAGPAGERAPSRRRRCRGTRASCGWISSTSSWMPDDIRRAAGLRADIVLREDAAGGEQQREARTGVLVGRHIFGDHELAPAAHEARRYASPACPRARVSLHGHCIGAELVEPRIGDARKGRRQARAISSMISEGWA